MKKFITGFIIGAILSGVGVAWAAGQFTWVFPDGTMAGTAAHPIYIVNQ